MNADEVARKPLLREVLCRSYPWAATSPLTAELIREAFARYRMGDQTRIKAERFFNAAAAYVGVIADSKSRSSLRAKKAARGEKADAPRVIVLDGGGTIKIVVDYVLYDLTARDHDLLKALALLVQQYDHASASGRSATGDGS